MTEDDVLQQQLALIGARMELDRLFQLFPQLRREIAFGSAVAEAAMDTTPNGRRPRRPRTPPKPRGLKRRKPKPRPPALLRIVGGTDIDLSQPPAALDDGGERPCAICGRAFAPRPQYVNTQRLCGRLRCKRTYHAAYANARNARKGAAA